jgi:hypothetical protein
MRLGCVRDQFDAETIGSAKSPVVCMGAAFLLGRIDRVSRPDRCSDQADRRARRVQARVALIELIRQGLVHQKLARRQMRAESRVCQSRQPVGCIG